MNNVNHPGVGLGSCGLNVTDLARSVDFYSATLGVEEVRSGVVGNSGYALLGHGGTVLLTLWEQAGSPAAHATAGMHHLSFEAPSLEALRLVRDRLVAHGVALREDVVTGDSPLTGQLFFEDPDGIRIEVYTEDPRCRWPDAEYAGQPAPRCGFYEEIDPMIGRHHG